MILESVSSSKRKKNFFIKLFLLKIPIHYIKLSNKKKPQQSHRYDKEITMVSTKGRYALRVMIDMAERHTDTYIPLKDIADKQQISLKYLEAIIKLLVRAKLVKGLRGKGGGYKLTRKPEEYTIGEILELTEGDLSPVACLTDHADACDRADSCPTLPMWKKLKQLEHDFYYGITLEDLMTPMTPDGEEKHQ